MTETIENSVKPGKLPNLSALGACLREIETEYIENDDGGVERARQALIGAIGEYHGKRFDLGRTIYMYKSYYAPERAWMAAVRAIAKAMDRDERTVRRILEDYQRASGVPASAITELKKRRLDPGAKKNEPVITKLREMPNDTIEADPEAAVDCALQSVKKPSQPVPESATDVSVGSGQEKLRLAIRSNIRRALRAVPTQRRLEELRLALEEEMFEWGVTEPITIALTPRPSILAADGSQRRQTTPATLEGAA